MKLIDVTSDFYAEQNEDSNEKGPYLKIGNHVRISKYSKIKNTVPWTYVISDVNGEKIAGSFYEKDLQKTSQEKFRIEKVLKRKGDKLYVKWKGYDNSFNNWIDKKDLIQKLVNNFLNRLEVLEEILKLIFQIMQQKLI